MDVNWISFIFLAIAIFGAAQEDIPLKTPDIYSLHISSDIKYRFATTKITSRVRNVFKTPSEAIFDVTLPNEAFITNLTLEIDGKIVVGEIKEKEAAKKQYQEAQMRGESAGYIGTKSRETNKFNLAVTVAAESKISFNLTYQELLRRKNSHYEQVIYIDPGQPVEDMVIDVAILESREITLLRVPPLRNDVGDSLADLSTLTVITQPTPKTGFVTFVPSVDHQLAQADSGMAGQFVVQYDVDRAMDAGDVLVVNGYFVHYFAPEGLEPIPHNVLFILDISGSMGGNKIRQLKEAMGSIIRQLIDGDRMNIMTFARTTHFWKNEMVDIMDEDVIDEALAYVNSLNPRGATDIELAIRDGLKFLNDDSLVDSRVRSPVIVFLTDGEATSGVQDKNEILKSVKRENEEEVPIFSLAFGEYADFDLVKKIALQNNGFGRKIYEASDAAMQIIGFYNEIAVTLLNNITFEYLDKPVENITKHLYPNYFNGSEVIVCGVFDDLSDAGPNNTELGFRVSAKSLNNVNIVLTGGFDNIIRVDDENLTHSVDFEMITEKIWAYLTIKQLLDKKLASDDDKTIADYTKQILDLSLKYGFVTPLTSMVVTLPEDVDEIEIKAAGLSSKAKRQNVNQSPSGIYPQAFIGSMGPAANFIPRSPAAGIRTFSRTVQYDSLPSQGLHGLPPIPPPVVSKSHSASSASLPPYKRSKSKKAHSRFPMLVDVSETLCLRLFDKELKKNPGIYLLHENTKEGVRIEVKLRKASSSGKKMSRQAVVEEVRLIADGSSSVVNKDTIKGNIANDEGRWNFSYRMSDPVGVVVTLTNFQLDILLSDDGTLYLIVHDVDTNSKVKGSGMLDRLLKANVVSQNSRQNVNGKEYGLFLIKKKRKMLLYRPLDSFYPDPYVKCFDLKKKESKLTNMAGAKLSDFTLR